MPTFYENLENLLAQNSLSATSLSKKLNFSSGQISIWKNNPNSKPSLDAVIKIANYFGITIDELVGNDNSSLDIMSNADKRLIQSLDNKGITADNIAELSTDNAELVIKLIESLIKNNSK